MSTWAAMSVMSVSIMKCKNSKQSRLHSQTRHLGSILDQNWPKLGSIFVYLYSDTVFETDANAIPILNPTSRVPSYASQSQTDYGQTWNDFSMSQGGQMGNYGYPTQTAEKTGGQQLAQTSSKSNLYDFLGTDYSSPLLGGSYDQNDSWRTLNFDQEDQQGLQ